MSIVEKGHSTDAGAFAAYVFLGNGKKYRKNLAQQTVRPGPAYCDLPKVKDFVKLANRCSKKIGSKEKLLTFVMSFKPDEMGHNDSDEAACLEMSVELAKKLFPHSPILAKVHADSNALHCHVGIANYDFETGRSIRKNKNLYYWRYLGDQIVKKHGLSVVDPYGKEKSQYTRNTEKDIKKNGWAYAKKHDYDLIMQQSINEAAAISQNFQDFSTHLAGCGIKVKYRIGKVKKTVPDPAKKGKKIKKMVTVPGIFYYMSDKDTDQQRASRNPRIRRRKASKLSRRFIYQELVKQFAKNQLEADKRAAQRIDKKKAAQRKAEREKEKKRLAPFLAADMAIANARFSRNPAIKKMRQSQGYQAELKGYVELEKRAIKAGARQRPVPKTKVGWENEYDSFYVDNWNVSADMNGKTDLWIKHSDLVNKSVKADKQDKAKTGTVIPGKPEKPSEAETEPVMETQASAAKTEPAVKTEPANSTEQSQPSEPEKLSENAMPTQPLQPSQPEAGSRPAQSTMPSVQPSRVAVKPFHHGDSIPAWQPIDAIGYESRAGHGIQGFYNREWTALVWLAHARQHFELSDRHEMQDKWLDSAPYIMWTRHAMAKAAKSKDPLVRRIGKLSEAVKSGYAKGYFDDMPGVKEAMALFKKQPASKPPLPGAQGSVPQEADKGVPVPGVNF